MKFMCSCGHVITDQTDNLPYKGHLRPDTSKEGMIETLDHSISNLVASVEAGETLEQLKNRYFNHNYPSGLSRKTMFFDSISKIWDDELLIYECSNCGRLAIDMRGHGGDSFLFFNPEDQAKRIFPGNLQGVVPPASDG